MSDSKENVNKIRARRSVGSINVSSDYETRFCSEEQEDLVFRSLQPRPAADCLGRSRRISEEPDESIRDRLLDRLKDSTAILFFRPDLKALIFPTIGRSRVAFAAGRGHESPQGDAQTKTARIFQFFTPGIRD